ncbi:MAG TPA: sigma-70 family RNA polymerase sigma factor [Mycobacteriales bacterium]
MDPVPVPGGVGHDTSEGPDTACLFRRARAGDQHAWNCLVARYTALLWRIGRAHHLSSADAADVVQTTWLRLLEHSDRISDPARLGGWLATTARRECLRVLRHAQRERPCPDDHETFDGAAPEAPVDADLLRTERDARLWSVLATLPERSRLLLRILMTDPPPSYDEVADALGIPRGSIGPTRARSLARLRQLLREN